MSKIQNPKSNTLIEYIPAELKEGLSWYISYYVIHPATGKMTRRRMKMNRIKSISERRKYCKKLVKDINIKLYEGWNPFKEDLAPKGFSKFSEVIPAYKTSIKKNNRPASYKSYESVLRKFEKWLKEKGMDNAYISDFTIHDARTFMRNIELEYDLGALAFNNNRTVFSLLFNWMIECGYVLTNPFSEIKKKKPGHKTRVQYIEAEERTKIIRYFENKNPQMSVFIKLMYHCLIRPGELVKLKISYIDFKNQTIKIPAAVAKNGKQRFATIPDVMFPEILNMELGLCNQNDYLFGKGQMRPSSENVDTRRTGDKWRKMREALGFDDTYQMYSLRDTGIIQKLKDGITPDEVMYQADHSSLEITSKYVRIANPKVYADIKTKASAF